MAQPDELTFEQFAMRYFSETSEGKCAHQKTQLHAPLLKRVWGDGDSHRVLVVWSALVIFLGDVKLKKKEYTINADEHGDGRTAKPIKVVVTNLDAIRIILSTGLKRESARDEIYCQICKQLVNNPDSHSHARAWIMLALCAGVFCPSPTFEKVLHNFIKERAPPGYLPYLLQRFARAEMAFQPRQHPASSVEVHSAFTGKKSQVQVYVYFKSIAVLADGATTPAEVMASLKRHPAIQGVYGLKLFMIGIEATAPGHVIDRMDPFASDCNVMDKITEFEALAGKGKEWTELHKAPPWQIVLRKQAFAPWCEGIANLELIYQQVWDGMERGIYYSANVEELAVNLAIRYFLTCGDAANQIEINRKVLVNQLKTGPVRGMEVKRTDEWANLVQAAFNSHTSSWRTSTAADLKAEVVEYARNTWTREFSLPYHHCTVRQKGRDLLATTRNGRLDLVDVTILLNSEGIIVTREVISYNNVEGLHSGSSRHEDIFTIPFNEIVWISQCKESDNYVGKDSFRIISLSKSGRSTFELEVASSQAMLIYKSMMKCVGGIKARVNEFICKL